MDVFILGAGRPTFGRKPSSLKAITLNSTAMDWQIHSFESVTEGQAIHFLGGYNFEGIVDDYPELQFTMVPDWKSGSPLQTLLQAPYGDGDALISYSDTLFRNSAIKELVGVDADVVFGVDAHWKTRYEQRELIDIEAAETITIEGAAGHKEFVEFTGLLYIKKNIVDALKKLDVSSVGRSVPDLLQYLSREGYRVKHYDVAGEWTEFNSPRDMAHFVLGTKAETLNRLEPVVAKSHIGKQVSFTTSQWSLKAEAILNDISATFGNEKLIVRSSSKGEDGWGSANAGGFDSLLNVDSVRGEVQKAVEAVIASYGSDKSGDDQVLVQQFIAGVRMAGVVFTCGLETGSPYYRFNFDDKSQSTESVTAGAQADLRTILVSRIYPQYLGQVAPEVVPVLEAVQELESILHFDKLDIEFAVDQAGVVHIFQVRPVTVNHDAYEIDIEDVKRVVDEGVGCFQRQSINQSHVLGRKTILANMPDWNPAEIIGTRPKPLAFSLYRELITNDVWAQQRAEFGYRDVTPFPLLVSLAGQPYVDVRASVSSFIPCSVSDDSAERIASAYISILNDKPELHDKLEFDIVFTIWVPDFYRQASQRLAPYGVLDEDIAQLERGLKKITQDALLRLDSDIASIDELNVRRETLEKSSVPVIDKVYTLLHDCKRYGTLAFAHAARAGFVAASLLKTLVANGVITEERRQAFLASFSTVAGGFEEDKRQCSLGAISQSQLVEKYGHLRPGTYELGAEAYWEDPQRYIFSDTMHEEGINQEGTFAFTEAELQAISEALTCFNGSRVSPEMIVEYLMKGTQAREAVKFDFTRNISKALDYICLLGKEIGLTRKEMSYTTYDDIAQLKLNVLSVIELKERIERRKRDYSLTCEIKLPSVIKSAADFYCFERFSSQPNFVTIKKTTGYVVTLDEDDLGCLKGKIVLIPQADPGYDWLFGQGIAGLITQYGGANSHMAIRAAEIMLPAAIGVGDKRYEKLSRMKHIELDCCSKLIREIS